MSRDAPILILGGGINGAAIARELVLQGRGVTLVDQGDIACGATAYSSRLIHGGLRYLEYGEFSLVRESLRERGLLLANAPQHVRPLRFFIPVERLATGMLAAAGKFLRLPLKFKPRPRGLLVVRTGLWLYDRFARPPRDAGAEFIRLPSAKSHRLEDPEAPQVQRKGTLGFCSYSDAQVQFPERFTIGLLRDAAAVARERGLPFAVHTYTRPRLEGATVVCEPMHAAVKPPPPFAPAAIINATGAWVDATLERLKIPADRLMGGTKGSHFFTWHPELREQLRGGAVYAEAADGRPVFVLPFGEGTLVGTTDLPFEGDPGAAVATEEELEYLLATVRSLFPQITFDRDDITLHGCGVRPLPFVNAKTTAAVTRRHWLVFHDQAPLPLLSVVGGKLTTCRSLAEETAAAVLKRLEIKFEPGVSRTRQLPPEPPRPKPGETLSADTLQTFFEDEHAVTLEDLVERRLMWLYEPDLRREHLAELATAIYAEESAVDRCSERLETHFGRELD